MPVCPRRFEGDSFPGRPETFASENFPALSTCRDNGDLMDRVKSISQDVYR